MDEWVLILVGYLLVINIIGLISMYVDKRKAAMQKYRISERTLLGIALIGGSLGSTIGMRSFKHKTKHTIFNMGLPTLVLIHGGIIIWLYLRIL